MFCPDLTRAAETVSVILEADASAYRIKDILQPILQKVKNCEYTKSRSENETLLRAIIESSEEAIRSEYIYGTQYEAKIKKILDEAIAVMKNGDLCKCSLKISIYCPKAKPEERAEIYRDVAECRKQGMSVSSYFNYGCQGKNKLQKQKILKWIGVAQDELRKEAVFKKIGDKEKFVRVFEEFLGRKIFILQNTSREYLENCIMEMRYAVLKPVDELNGNGIIFLDCKRITEEEISSIVKLTAKRKYILEEKIGQSKSIAAFHPRSLNTLRLVTFKDDRNVEVTSAILKIGTGNSKTDSFASGGLLVHVSAEGVCDTHAYNHKEECYETHPDSGIQFRGFMLPFWDEICEAVRSAAIKAAPAIFVGWDVTVGDNGEVYIIEGEYLC